MRRASFLFSACALACAASGHGTPGNPVPEYEIAYDDNRPSEAMSQVSATFEAMVRFKLPKKGQLLRLRALLARAGRVQWTLYAQGPLEQPGDVLATWERDYSDDLVSAPSEGKWVVEDLAARVSSSQTGALWIGFRRTGGEAALWQSGIDCENAFVRDTDPAKYLRPMPIRKTPMVRLDWGTP